MEPPCGRQRIVAERAVIADTGRDQGMRELHQDGGRPSEQDDALAIDGPRDTPVPVAATFARITARVSRARLASLHTGSIGTVPLRIETDAVTRLIQHVSQQCIMPRFRSLAQADISAKATDGDIEDIVTVADEEAEAALTQGLRALLDVPVIGEEAAAADASRLRLLDDEGARWVVDPLDGTKNFAAGNDGFGVMVSFVERRAVRAAWVHLPARCETFVAEQGGGAQLNGAALRVPDTAPAARPRASLFVRFMPADTREVFVAHVSPYLESTAACGAAAVEYTDVLRGRKDLVVYFRLLPWDHGAPALVLQEAGGVVTHLDGAPYTIASKNQVTILARTPDLAARVRAWAGARP